MRQPAKHFRRTTSDDQAKVIIQRIMAIDYELMSIGTGGSNMGRAPLNAKASDVLLRMQRQLRILRIDMEVERGFDCAPVVPDRQPARVWPRAYRRRKGR
ncbi:hypothetical protein JWJ88_13620 [Paracoccus methylovorus]|uniref:Uncharacterized protein n=1 Tax=Paracoccus methylovorus TaxID=2812658 RepID=A0ABX7JNZ5_9RHOB|nr:hypothetical protein [Paracoccus methylovorus]QRZ15389.1 hypothetical protein JWJ88_13620 [Paracoccus methylovorus]